MDLLEAAKAVVWKLSHNHDTPDYQGPARIDRNDAVIRDLVEAIAKHEAR